MIGCQFAARAVPRISSRSVSKARRTSCRPPRASATIPPSLLPPLRHHMDSISHWRVPEQLLFVSLSKDPFHSAGTGPLESDFGDSSLFFIECMECRREDVTSVETRNRHGRDRTKIVGHGESGHLRNLQSVIGGHRHSRSEYPTPPARKRSSFDIVV